MGSYHIRGGKPLSGTVKASGNKNAALPCLAAAMLTDEKLVLRNIPEIEDVQVMISIMKTLGVSVEPLPGERSSYTIKRDDLRGDIPRELADAIRASILFAGPLLALQGSIVLPPPGGDVIGHRRLDTHFLVFSSFGGKAELQDNGDIYVRLDSFPSGDTTVFLDEASVTATENAIMLAVMAKKGTETLIRHAAGEPHVQNLCSFLQKMGAEISGIGSNLLRIKGGLKLHGCDYTIGSDYMEIGSFIGLAAAVKGEITIQGVEREHMPMIEMGFARLGITWEYSGNALCVPAEQHRKIVPEVGGAIPHIDDGPWPTFPSDLMSILAVTATQNEGTILIHEKMFESRMFFIDILIRMGAGIVLCDPHRAVITGPSRLHGQQVDSPDVRAGMALVIASLCASGRSTIRNIYQIERGYEGLCRKLVSLGADVTREDDQVSGSRREDGNSVNRL